MILKGEYFKQVEGKWLGLGLCSINEIILDEE